MDRRNSRRPDRTLKGAHNALLDLEELDEAAIERLRGNYKKLAALEREDLTEMLDAVETVKGKKEVSAPRCLGYACNAQNMVR
jgi:hypothetical protein